MNEILKRLIDLLQRLLTRLIDNVAKLYGYQKNDDDKSEAEMYDEMKKYAYEAIIKDLVLLTIVSILTMIGILLLRYVHNCD